MNLRQALNNAVVLLLRPLVRVLLRHGLAYGEGTELAQTMNRAAKVVVGWLHEHTPLGGSPATLDGEQFSALVRKHSGDMPARAVLDELQHSGAVSVGEDGRLQLGRQRYVPQATDPQRVVLVGQHAADLLGAIEHNLTHPPEQAYLQRRVFADHIPAERLDAVREQLREAGLSALANARERLIENDAGDAQMAPGARRVTLGVYYFEEPVGDKE